MDKLFCINDTCGHLLGGKVKYCPFCGHPQSSSENILATSAVVESNAVEDHPKSIEVVYSRKIRNKSQGTKKSRTNRQARAIETKDHLKQEHYGFSAEGENDQDELRAAHVADQAKPVQKTVFNRKFSGSIGDFIKYTMFFLLVAYITMIIVSPESDDSSGSSPGSVQDRAQRNQQFLGMAKSGKVRLYIDAQPGNARVRVMNIKAQYKDGIALQPGKYDIEVSHPGYQAQRRYIELSEKKTTFRFILEKSLKVSAVNLPKGGYATRINGQKWRLPLEVGPGEVEFYLTAPGYYQQFFNINIDGNSTVKAALSPVRCLVINSDWGKLGSEVKVTFDLGPISRDRVIDSLYKQWKSLEPEGAEVKRNQDQLSVRQQQENRNYFVERSARVYQQGDAARVELISKLSGHIPVLNSLDTDTEVEQFCNGVKGL